jgi:hypothetical protein
MMALPVPFFHTVSLPSFYNFTRLPPSVLNIPFSSISYNTHLYENNANNASNILNYSYMYVIIEFYSLLQV